MIEVVLKHDGRSRRIEFLLAPPPITLANRQP